MDSNLVPKPKGLALFNPQSPPSSLTLLPAAQTPSTLSVNNIFHFAITGTLFIVNSDFRMVDITLKAVFATPRLYLSIAQILNPKIWLKPKRVFEPAIKMCIRNDESTIQQ